MFARSVSAIQRPVAELWWKLRMKDIFLWVLSRLKDNKGNADGAMSRLKDRKETWNRKVGNPWRKRHLLVLESFKSLNFFQKFLNQALPLGN